MDIRLLWVLLLIIFTGSKKKLKQKKNQIQLPIRRFAGNSCFLMFYKFFWDLKTSQWPESKHKLVVKYKMCQTGSNTGEYNWLYKFDHSILWTDHFLTPSLFQACGASCKQISLDVLSQPRIPKYHMFPGIPGPGGRATRLSQAASGQWEPTIGRAGAPGGEGRPGHHGPVARWTPWQRELCTPQELKSDWT